jgi:hypothetical protein
MQPIDGCVTHDCWTVAFGNASTTNKIVSKNYVEFCGNSRYGNLTWDFDVRTYKFTIHFFVIL